MFECRIVLYQGKHHLCRKAVVDRDGEKVWVWIDGLQFVCFVGKEEYAWPLPASEGTNFYSDRFKYAIDRRFTWSERWEKFGGSDNIIVARAAFEAAVLHEQRNMIVRLRDGGYTIQEHAGQMPD